MYRYNYIFNFWSLTSLGDNMVNNIKDDIEKELIEESYDAFTKEFHKEITALRL
jgi:hypothetical protein